MIRRLNYTGRIKIDREDVRLASYCEKNDIGFSASLNLSRYELPSDCPVFLEAYRQTTWMRFGFGTVGAPPASGARHQLTAFDSLEGVLFRIKISQAHDEHVLVAAADRIPLAKPEDEAETESLLTFVPVELGNELWRVRIDGEPEFHVNKLATANPKELALSPVFAALVYPEVLRRVLLHILVEEKVRDTTDDLDWRSKWLRFATLLPGVDPEPPDPEDGDRVASWVNDAVAAFSTKLEMRDRFNNAWQLAGGE